MVLSNDPSSAPAAVNPSSLDAAVADVWRRYKQSPTQHDRNILLEYYRGLVESAAERLHRKLPGSVDVDDLVSAGVFGLMEAIDAFEPARNISFKTFCSHRVRGAMLDEVRSTDWVPRHSRQWIRKIEEARASLHRTLGRLPDEAELTQQMGVTSQQFRHLMVSHQPPHFSSLHQRAEGEDHEVSMAATIPDARSESGLSVAQRRELKDWILRGLSRSEQLIVSLYYYEAMTLKEIGLTLELSESRVSQILKTIMARLRTRAAASWNTPFRAA
jgi:RNA polymerase sigma factor for flagellar operon FliA